MRRTHFTVANGNRYCKAKYKPSAKLRPLPTDIDCRNCLSKFIRSYGLKRRPAAPPNFRCVVHPVTPEDKRVRMSPRVDIAIPRFPPQRVKVYRSLKAIERDFGSASPTIGPRKPPKHAPLRYRTRSS